MEEADNREREGAKEKSAVGPGSGRPHIKSKSESDDENARNINNYRDVTSVLLRPIHGPPHLSRFGDLVVGHR